MSRFWMTEEVAVSTLRRGGEVDIEVRAPSDGPNATPFLECIVSTERELYDTLRHWPSFNITFYTPLQVKMTKRAARKALWRGHKVVVEVGYNTHTEDWEYGTHDEYSKHKEVTVRTVAELKALLASYPQETDDFGGYDYGYWTFTFRTPLQ